jgi:hypothetical protein
MSYDKCILYLNWLEKMRFIIREIDEKGSEMIHLSEKGTQIYDLLKDSNNFNI